MRMFPSSRFYLRSCCCLSAYGLPVENPITGATYANGIIPGSAFTPLGTAVLSALPAPNLPGNSNNYESSPADTFDNNKGDVRIDYGENR